jgi:hypothetical protein
MLTLVRAIAIKQNVRPNLPHLQAALDRIGPWKGQHQAVDIQWVVAKLDKKIVSIDWKAAAADVERFLLLGSGLPLQSSRGGGARVRWRMRGGIDSMTRSVN